MFVVVILIQYYLPVEVCIICMPGFLHTLKSTVVKLLKCTV